MYGKFKKRATLVESEVGGAESRGVGILPTWASLSTANPETLQAPEGRVCDQQCDAEALSSLLLPFILSITVANPITFHKLS